MPGPEDVNIKDALQIIGITGASVPLPDGALGDHVRAIAGEIDPKRVEVGLGDVMLNDTVDHGDEPVFLVG